MEIPLHQIDAFADGVFSGNPAAVCPLEEWVPDDLMQAIAMENNLSETAFFVKSGESYHIRWFTPVAEVSLCGHATLASAYVLFNEGRVEGDEVRLQSLSGELRVTRAGELLTLDFPAQLGGPCAIPEGLAEALGTTPLEVYRAMDYMAVFESEDQVRSLEPDVAALRRLDLRGVIVTAPGREVDFVSRFFAPKFGVNEDPVTGSAHCKLAPYWAVRLGKNRLTARQLSKRGGSLVCEVAGDRVLISGRAVPYLKGTIRV